MRPGCHLQGQSCPKCPRYNQLDNKSFINKAEITHGENRYKYLSDYVNAKSKIKIKCLICNNIFEQQAYSHLGGRGCKICSANKASKRYMMNISDFEDKCKEKHNNKYEYCQDYSGKKNKIKVWCKNHKEYFEINAGSHLYGGVGCAKCRCSHGEVKVACFLDKNNIVYEYEKKFPNCQYKRQLSFDFYLPLYNLCIEYDGEQHETGFRYKDQQIKLEEIKIRDKIKNQYCLDNNINLLRIPHRDFDNIEEILKKLYDSGFSMENNY